MILEEHQTLLLLKEASSNRDFSDIEERFDSMAVRIELMYWKHYEIKHLTAIQSDNWLDELKKKILLSFAKIILTLIRFNYYLFWSFPLLFIFIAIDGIIYLFGYEIMIIEVLKALAALFFLSAVTSGLILMGLLELINKALKNLKLISGDTFIKDQVEYQKKQRDKEKF